MIFGKDKKVWEELSGAFTATEINQQPATWAKTLAQVKKEKEEIAKFISQVTSKKDYDIILTGAGTSEFVGNTLYSYLNKLTNFKCKSYATTDLVATPENYLSQTKATLLISLGRSGNSPESIGAIDVAEKVCSNLFHIFITCNKDGALSKRAEKEKNCFAINLTDETHDKSFAMTSSFTNMMLATLLCFNLENIDTLEKEINDISKSASNLLTTGYEQIENLLVTYNFDRIVYLGTNALKGIAQESALKMLELSAGKVITMFDTPLGFRHGPKSIINDNTLCVVYLSDDKYTRGFEVDLIKEMSGQRKGNKILAVSSYQDEEVALLVDSFINLNTDHKMSNVMLAFDYIIVAQIIALFKAISFKITPDNPCPSGEVNRVVKGVTLYPYNKEA